MGQRSERDENYLLEESLKRERRKQPGVAFPSAAKQEHILIIRLDLSTAGVLDRESSRSGLSSLCKFLASIDSGAVKVEELMDDRSVSLFPLSRYNFSATIGFGSTFFSKLGIRQDNRPKNIYSMPDHAVLGDGIPYTLRQTDMILQLCSNSEFVNRSILQIDSYHKILSTVKKQYKKNGDKKSGDSSRRIFHDIESTIEDWAIITDFHSGFQRLNGRNLMGFHDGISNPDRLNNDIVWTKEDQDEKYSDGTFMVFQKIEHDLEKWRKLSVSEQENLVGRSKATGLFLGTLSEEDDAKLASDCISTDPLIQKNARAKLKEMLDKQRNYRTRFFDGTNPDHASIQVECPVWSHVRKSNPRGADGVPGRFIYRRGYLFMHDGFGGKVTSGLLFICFQRNVADGFEYIKRNYLNNKDFPVPIVRKKFTKQELASRHRAARYSEEELKALGPVEKAVLGLDLKSYQSAIEKSRDPDSQNTGKEGLSGPSKLGINPTGEFVTTVTLGGGYYFIPPIPHKDSGSISEQFFG